MRKPDPSPPPILAGFSRFSLLICFCTLILLMFTLYFPTVGDATEAYSTPPVIHSGMESKASSNTVSRSVYGAGGAGAADPKLAALEAPLKLRQQKAAEGPPA